MKKLLMALFALCWCAVVFVVTFWATFPSDALVDRVRWEVPQRLGKEYAIDLASVSPWWVGVSAQDAKLYHTPQGWRGGDQGETSLVGLARDLRIRVSPLSLLRRSPYVSGSLTLAEGTIDYAVGASAGAKGGVGVSELSLQADKLPLGDLLMLASTPDLEVSATGALDLDIEIEAGDEGMSDGQGHIRIGGANIVLSDLVVPGVGPLGMEIPLNEIVLVAEVRDGKATVQRGLVDSGLLKIDIKGDITLRDPVDRSQVDLEFVVTELGPELQAFEMMLAPAKQSDGYYHYALRGMVSRLSAASFQPSRGGSGRVSSGDRPRSRTVTPRPERAPQEVQPETDEERERRRQEIRERLEARRREREGQVREPEPVDEDAIEDDPPLEEEPLEEEEFFDEPIDEEEFVEEFE